MTPDKSGLGDIRRRIDEIKVLITAARKRHEAGERLNLTELQARADSIRRMASEVQPQDTSDKASLRSTLEATATEMDALSDLVSISQANLLRRISVAEKSTAPAGAGTRPEQ